MTKVQALARLRAVAAAHADIQDQEHRAVLDAVVAGASLTEIGDQLGIPRQTVRHRINAARKALGIEK